MFGGHLTTTTSPAIWSISSPPWCEPDSFAEGVFLHGHEEPERPHYGGIKSNAANKNPVL